MHLEEVFKWLKDTDLKIKCSKCEFFKSKAYYLGYLVGANGVQPPGRKGHSHRGFGTTSEHRGTTALLRACWILQKIYFILHQWTEECNKAFDMLKSELVKMPRLQYPNPNKTLESFTDASKHSYSSVLHQEETPNKVNTVPKLVPKAYFSSSFSRMQQLWNTTQKECYTVCRSVQKFSFYLAGTKCILHYDHKPLAPFSLWACPVWYLSIGH